MKRPDSKAKAHASPIRTERVEKKASRTSDGADEGGRQGLWVVGIGASAGGLEALHEFITEVAIDSGITFVIVTHQHPGHLSLLAELLGEHAKIPVAQAEDGVRVQPDHAYLAPPGTRLEINRGILSVIEVAPDDERSRHLPIDSFFRSLAKDQRERSVAIVLSGTGSDGTLGVGAIKAAGGMAMVQEPATAKYSGMPASAIATGLVDFVLPPSEIPDCLRTYFNGPFLDAASTEERRLPAGPIQKILLLVRSRTGHDFTSYKTTTLRRRIERRMLVRQAENPEAYIELLKQNPQEIEVLFKELLISVTSFFRDKEAFAKLAEKALPAILARREDGETIRAWVAGCATGEEAYSLAIALREVAERNGRQFDYQIFATDLDSQAVDTARKGVYPQGIVADLAPPLLAKYFSREESTYRVRRDIRDMCVFAQQNVIRDPPFMRLDLVLCRNLMIYLENDLQQRLLPIFHHVLTDGGILMLGPSETLGGASKLFDVMSKKWKIFTRRSRPSGSMPPEIPAQAWLESSRARETSRSVAPKPSTTSIGALVERMLLAKFAPSGVVVNAAGDIIYVHGRTGLYLEPATGQPNMNVLDMAREGLKIELASCLRQAVTDEKRVERKNIRVKSNGDFAFVDATLSRILDPEGLRGLYLIVLRPSDRQAADSGSERNPATASSTGTADSTAQLERELQYARDSLQITVEELQTSNEELKATNEELQSTNEELQSSNEELETSQEEMQSMNEELNTVNSELQDKVDQLSHASDDMANLLNSTEIATIFLDAKLRIKSYTEPATKLVHLIRADVGRPLSDLSTHLESGTFQDEADEVQRTLVVKESEVETVEGQRYLMRIMPYRTAANVIDGVVITFVDITDLSEATNQAAAALELYGAVVETVRGPVAVLDGALRVQKCNRAFYETFGLSPDRTEGALIYDLADGAWGGSELRRLLEEILPRDTTIEGFVIDHDYAGIGRRRLVLNARKLDLSGRTPVLLLAMEDRTGPVSSHEVGAAAR